MSHRSGFTLGAAFWMAEERLDPLGISCRGSRVCGDKSLCSLIWLSKDLRMLQCHARVFAGDVSDDTFLYVTA